jgi:hypothetical protein
MPWIDQHIESDLRKEIIESQKSLSDFMKWKLIAIASIGSVVLGSFDLTNPTAVPKFGLLIALIPLLCAYIDLISVHLILRIIVIGVYIQKAKQPQLVADGAQTVDYEAFVNRVLNERRNYFISPFGLETAALHVSTLILAIFVVLVGNYWAVSFVEKLIYNACAIIGFAIPLFLLLTFKLRVQTITTVSTDMKKP